MQVNLTDMNAVETKRRFPRREEGQHGLRW
jgi:hypothetical protein